jgi:hypothetical protein
MTLTESLQAAWKKGGGIRDASFLAAFSVAKNSG